MTNARLKRRLIASGLIVAVFIGLSIAEYLKYGRLGSNFIGSNGTLIALLFASYIAYVFQQRAKLAEDVRKWWFEIVNAKSEFFIYCDKTICSEDDYLKAFYKLSAAMDNLRVIYCNVHRDQNQGKGYYPFEQVRDIIDLAQSIPYSSNPSFHEKQKIKNAIILAFGSLRHAIQSEATSLTPDRPVLFKSQERDMYVGKMKTSLAVDLNSIRRANGGL